MGKQLFLPEGYIVNGTYEILEEIGSGYEGHVYLVRELATGIERTIKIFDPKRNKGNKTLKAVAKKLHRVRSSNILIQYHTQDTVTLPDGQTASFLVSEFTDGVMLSDFLKNQPGGRLHPFAALHLLHALVTGVEGIHRLGEYHADIHLDNILVERVGLSFQLKLLDPFHWTGATKRDGQKDDICNVVEVFYDALGGTKHYAKQPQVVKDICKGMKRPLILKSFGTISKLKNYLENVEW